MKELIQSASKHSENTAIVSGSEEYTYASLLTAAESFAQVLLNGQNDLKEARIAFMVRPGFDYVKVQWAIWRAGGVAVPLSLHSPLPALEYVIEDAQCSQLVADQEFEVLLEPLIDSGRYRFHQSDTISQHGGKLPEIIPERRAMIIYTSGTTGKPKGVVSTHANIASQINTLVEAWQWSANDHILNVLPLHHVHGVINVVSCALWSGACCEFVRQFDADLVIKLLSGGKINTFMAVPTIYYKLIDQWKRLPEHEQQRITQSFSQFRLMVSGSAALPVSVMEEWETISGQRLLERYGMTEIGMAISNPYKGERKAGHIGQALPGVSIRIVNESGQEVETGEAGEIQVKGPNVFKEYWNKPQATQGAFTSDGWFKTGDVAVLAEGSYRILGRKSVDIIKSGGYKISALEIEEVLRTHPEIADCAVVGIPDPEWDEVIAAGVVSSSEPLDFDSIKSWLKERLPPYQLPRKFMLLQELPRNAMGKVTKPALKEMFINQQ